jgi:phenylacetate-CoA ligase
MARFDDWVTNPAVTRPLVDEFVADPSPLGANLLGRYVMFKTSGSTGMPAILIQDEAALAMMNGLAISRGVSIFAPRDWWRVWRGGMRQAAVFANGGQYLGATMMVRRLRQRPWWRRIARLFSALTPLPQLFRDLNHFRPAMLGGYPSAISAGRGTTVMTDPG